MSTRMSRRDWMKFAGLGTLAMAVGGGLTGGTATAEAEVKPGALPQVRPYELPPLPYAYNALEPVLSEELLKLHHDKHHAGYVAGLNTALEKLKKARESNDAAQVKALSRDLAFHGSGHILHTLYWQSLKPGGSAAPQGIFADAVQRDFGSFDALKLHFTAAAKDVEASGWAVLAWEPLGRRLLVFTAEKHQDLTIWGVVPICVIDSWEHAYYLQYQNRRPEYVDKVFTLIDWQGVAGRFGRAINCTTA